MRNLEHPNHRQILVQPLLDRGTEDGGSTLAIPFLRFLINLFFEHLGNCISVMPGELSNLDLPEVLAQ